MDPVYLSLEIGAAGFFMLAAWLAWRRGRLPFLELVSAAIFGLLLEEGDQLIYETYHYSESWVLVIDRAPIVIALTWALIIAGAMRITDALGVRRRWAPFVDSVLAIMLDLAFDAVAIRMGLWTWREVGPTDGWFGVPAGNFYAWLFVTWGFSFFSRWLRQAARPGSSLEWLQLLVPIPAFALLLLSIAPFGIITDAVDPSPGGGLLLFAITLAAFLSAAWRGVFGPGRHWPLAADEAILDIRLAFLTRAVIHLFFIGGLFVLGLAAELPLLLAVSVALLLAEIPLAWLVAVRQRRRVIAGRVRG